MMNGRHPTLGELRSRIRKLEGGGREDGRALPIGVAEIDGVLPAGGFALGCAHELIEAGGDACSALALHMAAKRLEQGDGAIVWVANPTARIGAGPLYAPGLIERGVPPGRVVMARAREDSGALWAMEEALRCPAVSVVIAEANRIGMTQSRRLQLAAETGACLGLLLRPMRRAADGGFAALDPSAAITRWEASTAPSRRIVDGAGWWIGPARWRLTLTRNRGGGTGTWIVEKNDETGDLTLVAAPDDGTADLRDRELLRAG